MKLTQEQIDILWATDIVDNKLYIKSKLEPKKYKEINDILETIWLKWSRKDKAHVADLTNDELETAIEDIIQTGEVVTLKETIKKYQFYETPRSIADKIIEDYADIQDDDIVLEPSAGKWGIARHLRCKQKLDCVEINPQYMIELKELCKFWENTEYYNQDFLSFHPEKRYDKIIANPPFSKSQDVKHILHMYELLKDGWRIVSIASASVKYRTGKIYEQFRDLNPEIIDIEEWAFKDSGTMVNTVIVIINK